MSSSWEARPEGQCRPSPAAYLEHRPILRGHRRAGDRATVGARRAHAWLAVAMTTVDMGTSCSSRRSRWRPTRRRLLQSRDHEPLPDVDEVRILDVIQASDRLGRYPEARRNRDQRLSPTHHVPDLRDRDRLRRRRRRRQARGPGRRRCGGRAQIRTPHRAHGRRGRSDRFGQPCRGGQGGGRAG